MLFQIPHKYLKSFQISFPLTNDMTSNHLSPSTANSLRWVPTYKQQNSRVPSTCQLCSACQISILFPSSPINCQSEAWTAIVVSTVRFGLLLRENAYYGYSVVRQRVVGVNVHWVIMWRSLVSNRSSEWNFTSLDGAFYLVCYLSFPYFFHKKV